MKINGKLIVFTIILIALATACKYFFGPNLAWSGFSPVIAIALFTGMMIPKKDTSFLLPLLALLISDVLIQVLFSRGLFPYSGFYSGQWVNYLLLLSATLIGWAMKGRSYGSILGGAIAAPTVFFLLSNFSVWIGAQILYPKTFDGLMTCYTAGFPFYKNALMSTIIFLPVILLLYNYMMKQKTQLTLA